MPEDAQRRIGVRDAVLATIATIVVSNVLAVLLVAATGYEEFDDAPIGVLVLAQVPLWACLVGFPVWLSRRRGTGSPVRDLRLGMRWADAPVGIAAAFATQIAILVFIPLYELFDLDHDKVGESAEELADRAGDPLEVILLVVMAVLAAGAFEEVFYRGLWLRALDRFRPVLAVVASSVVFSLVHFQPYGFLPLLVVGAVAATLTIRAGRIGPAVWMHMAFNGITLAALLAG